MALRKLGQILVDLGHLTEDQLWDVLEEQKQSPGEVIGQVAVRMGLIGDAQVTEALAEQWGMAIVNLQETTVPPKALELVPQTMAELYKVMPIALRDGVLTVAMADPQNVGAILRSADAAGAHGVIRQARHAAPLDGATAKASAGAVSHVRIATVVNIARAIEELKTLNIWTIGLDAGAADAYDQVDYRLPTAFVVGAEGTGLRRLVRETCDRLVSIPMQGGVASLNVSVAAGVALFEASRQRRRGG